MSRLFAVSHINWHNHALTTEFHEAENWREAAMQHKNIAEMFTLDVTDPDRFFLPEEHTEGQAAAFDNDAMINVVEVPPEFLNPNRA